MMEEPICTNVANGNNQLLIYQLTSDRSKYDKITINLHTLWQSALELARILNPVSYFGYLQSSRGTESRAITKLSRRWRNVTLRLEADEEELYQRRTGELAVSGSEVMMRMAFDHSFFLHASATALSGSLPAFPAVDAIAKIALQQSAEAESLKAQPWSGGESSLGERDGHTQSTVRLVPRPEPPRPDDIRSCSYPSENSQRPTIAGFAKTILSISPSNLSHESLPPI